MLIIDHLIVGYNAPCTNPIMLTIDKPGIYGIIGPNGSGKSTFLKTILGLNAKLAGTYQVNALTKFAYVPQHHTVNRYFHLSLKDFVKQGYGPQPSNADAAEQYIKEWQLSEQQHKCFHELSGGQKTRAMIIRALVSKPELICLDEPLASLDSCCQQQLMTTLADLVKYDNTYVLLSDHHLDKFEKLMNGWIEFIKHHDDKVSSVTYLPQKI